jgi:hypothetical protein
MLQLCQNLALASESLNGGGRLHPEAQQLDRDLLILVV